jgi:hypothetical protein
MNGGVFMKLFVKLLAVIATQMVCGIVGFVIGTYFGGNYAVDFTFNGVRGYEAMGQIGLIVSAFIGGPLCWWIVFRSLKKREHRLSDKETMAD